MKEFLRIILMLVIPGPVTFPTDVTDVLEAKHIRYEIVAEVPEGHDAFYSFKNDTIYFSKEASDKTFRLSYLAAHELIHRDRFLAGIMTNDEKEEERIAIFGAEQKAREVGLPSFEIDEQKVFEKTCKDRGL